MNLTLIRKVKYDTYTIGELYIDGKYFCDTLEDRDRNLIQGMDLSEIKKIKVPGETAIPSGTYKITLDVVSPKFSKYPFYIKVCEGKLPRLLNVKGFDGILIHVADGYKRDKLLEGCIGIGNLDSKGYLYNGKVVFKNLWNTIKNEKDCNDLNIKIGYE